MRKFLISLIATSMLLLPCIQVTARSGDAAAGMAAGLMGGALISGIASSNRGHSRRAEEEAREARQETARLRQDQQRERVSGIERQIHRRDTSTTVNLLIFTVVLLFLGLLTLGTIVLKRK
ncbi:hypothetical protein KAT92_00160 [Candidatus Babeliales bacterium]|nr:hypothetical protein [Candidatus Babeliales bacterium]